MSLLLLRKPRLPSHYYLWAEPPDNSGDEVLHFVSARRSLELKGHSFREFLSSVVPLLDGRHTLEAIQQSVAEVFRPEDLVECLQLLSRYNLLQEGDDGLDPETAVRLRPQLNFFHEFEGHPEAMQPRLAQATVTLLGMGGAGAATARALAAAGVGTIRCVDSLPVQAADVYLSQVFRMQDVGQNRATTVAALVRDCAPGAKVIALDQAIDTESELRLAVQGSHFLISCLDPGQSNLIIKLNRVCLDLGIRWTSCQLCGAEVILGPTVHPLSGPCYLCYRMRVVACALSPEGAFAYEQHLDRRKLDDSGKRENLTFGAGLAANLLGLETLKELTGVATPSASGRIIVVNLLDLTCARHVVLRKPWCPACFQKKPPGPTEGQPEASVAQPVPA